MHHQVIFAYVVVVLGVIQCYATGIEMKNISTISATINLATGMFVILMGMLIV